MKSILTCRRTFIAFTSIVCLTGLGLHGTADVASAIATVAMALAAANAAEAGVTAHAKAKMPVQQTTTGDV